MVRGKTKSKVREPFLLGVVAVLLIKMTIELFYGEWLTGASEIVFWSLITLALTIYFFLKKNYIFSGIVFAILLVGLINI